VDGGPVHLREVVARSASILDLDGACSRNRTSIFSGQPTKEYQCIVRGRRQRRTRHQTIDPPYETLPGRESPQCTPTGVL